jgi:diadenosine tetraphosphate (Ap4A) HIT family hydrolase
MGLPGEAISRVCAPQRVNYSIYGNTDPYLHAHVVPRYDWEPPDRVLRPVWDYPMEQWSDPVHGFDPSKHNELRLRIASTLNNLAANQSQLS